MGKKYRVSIWIFFFVFFSFSFAQKQTQKEIRKGNIIYKRKKYIEAEMHYRKALENNAYFGDAIYNLGNALYKQGKIKESLKQYQTMIKNEMNPKKISMAWHNEGNVYMKTKNYQKSIEAYKNSLRKNPTDEETRYNLTLAQKLLQQTKSKEQEREKQEQEREKQEQEREKQEQERKKQEQEREKQEQERKKQEQERKKQEQERKKQEQEREKQEQEREKQFISCKISRENADQILEALLQNERTVQKTIYKPRAKHKITDKNW